MSVAPDCQPLHPIAEEFFGRAVSLLGRSGIPFLVGGGYAMRVYTGICRKTKDLDVFVRPRDCPLVLDRFSAEGFCTELTDPCWLAKVRHEEHFVDVIFSSDKVGSVDDEWFQHSVPGSVFGQSVRLVPPEEMIWSKAFVMERERYDGADIAHLVLACGARLDWHRLLARMEGAWELLLSHLPFFRFVYPEERGAIPAWLIEELSSRLAASRHPASARPRTSRGPLVSKKEFSVDLEVLGFEPPS